MKKHTVVPILACAFLALAHANPPTSTGRKPAFVGEPIKRVVSPAATASSSVAAVMQQTPEPVAAPTSAPAPVPAPKSYKLTPGTTVRSTLQVWSNLAGWTFLPEHYAVAVDIPVLASSDLGEDFKAAVRTLLDSTTFTDTPVQPCFYSNSVVRVVLRTERCDRL